MPTPRLSATLQRLTEFGLVRSRSGVNQKEITRAENALGVVFPEEYRKFLRRYGVMSIGDRSVMGLGPGTEGHWCVRSVVWMTEYFRQREPSFPDHLVVLWDDGHSTPHCFQLGGGEARSAPVVQWSSSGKVIPIAESMDDWVVVKLMEARKEESLWNLTDSRRPPRPMLASAHPDWLETTKGATQSRILAAQRDLGVTFPADYSMFLRRLGSVLVRTIPWKDRRRSEAHRLMWEKLQRKGFNVPERPVHDRFIFGLGAGMDFWENPERSLLFQTAVARRSARLLLPRRYLPIWDDWHYYFTCLDLGASSGKSCAVVAFDWDSFQRWPPRPRRIAPSFTSWFELKLNQVARAREHVLS